MPAFLKRTGCENTIKKAFGLNDSKMRDHHVVPVFLERTGYENTIKKAFGLNDSKTKDHHVVPGWVAVGEL